MVTKPERTIVIGCGTRNSHDDAAGLMIVNELRNQPHFDGDLRTVDEDSERGQEHFVANDAVVIFLDTVDSSAAPGTFHCARIPSSSVKPRHAPASLVSSAEAPAVSSRMFFIGIAVADVSAGTGLSPKVRLAVDQLVKDFSYYRKLAHDLTAECGK